MTSGMPERDAWSIPGVYLLTKGGDGRVAIPHLTLTFVPKGIELAKANDEVVWSCTWSKMEELTMGERSTLPDGTDGVVMTVAEPGGRQHRFVLPTSDPADTEAAIRNLAASHRVKGVAPPAAVSRRLTIAVAVSTGATLTILLLSAAHIIHF
jgi:hypothetical protein